MTAVGYQGGTTPNPTYREACTGKTGHAEAVRVVFDPSVVTYERLLKLFWEDHDPTQGYRQGNDVGTQYRSAIYAHGPAQLATAIASRDMYQQELSKAGFGSITTEIREAPEFYFAEDYHQQYLVKVPNGYCPNHSTGVPLPDDFVVDAAPVRRLDVQGPRGAHPRRVRQVRTAKAPTSRDPTAMTASIGTVLVHQSRSFTTPSWARQAGGASTRRQHPWDCTPLGHNRRIATTPVVQKRPATTGPRMSQMLSPVDETSSRTIGFPRRGPGRTART